MRTTFWIILAVLITALLAPSPGEADSYRCGRKLIRSGDTTADVLRVCGEPVAKDRGRADVRDGGVTRNVAVQRWHYRQSGRSLPRIVKIWRGRVVSIEVGRR